MHSFAYYIIYLVTLLFFVGDADDLKKLGIPVVANLPGVGQNLQDHLEVCVQQKSKKVRNRNAREWFLLNLIFSNIVQRVLKQTT